MHNQPSDKDFENTNEFKSHQKEIEETYRRMKKENNSFFPSLIKLLVVGLIIAGIVIYAFPYIKENFIDKQQEENKPKTVARVAIVDPIDLAILLDNGEIVDVLSTSSIEYKVLKIEILSGGYINVRIIYDKNMNGLLQLTNKQIEKVEFFTSAGIKVDYKGNVIKK